MADNLRITTPIANTEGINRPNPADELTRLNPVNPNRVPRTDNNEETGGQAADLLLNRSSVYSEFIQQLQQAPGLDRTLEKLLGDAVARQAVPGQAAALLQNLPSSLQALVTSMATQESGLLKDLVSQQDDATLFTGPLFKLLGQISAQTGDPQLDLHIADFLKAYSGYANAAGTTQAVLNNLNELKYSIPLPYARRLSGVMEKLAAESAGAEHVDANLLVLKKEIIPLLSEYVTKTNDYGKPRDAISMLLHNTAILNDSTRENLAAKFDQLMAYGRNNLGLPGMTLDMMQSLFAQELTADKSAKQSAFMQALTSLLSRMSDKDVPEGVDRAALTDISRSMLLDNSVFMPFQHLLLPAEINGRFIFSQMWIEKTDPDESRRTAAGHETSKTIYLTFDIQDLGYFEASVRVSGKQVSVRLACPAALSGLHGEIRSGVAGILKKNGLSPEEVRLSTASEPKVPQMILQKVQERKRAVDVSV